MYTYGRGNKILNPRAETLGEALSILYDIAPSDRQKSISRTIPTHLRSGGVLSADLPTCPIITTIPSGHGWVPTGRSRSEGRQMKRALSRELARCSVPPPCSVQTRRISTLTTAISSPSSNSSNMLRCLAGLKYRHHAAGAFRHPFREGRSPHRAIRA